MKIYNNIEKYIETTTDIVFNTFRDKYKIIKLLKDSIESGDVESLKSLSKNIDMIAKEISDIYKLTKKIDNIYQDDLGKIFDKEKKHD